MAGLLTTRPRFYCLWVHAGKKTCIQGHESMSMQCGTHPIMCQTMYTMNLYYYYGLQYFNICARQKGPITSQLIPVNSTPLHHVSVFTLLAQMSLLKTNIKTKTKTNVCIQHTTFIWGKTSCHKEIYTIVLLKALYNSRKYSKQILQYQFKKTRNKHISTTQMKICN